MKRICNVSGSQLVIWYIAIAKLFGKPIEKIFLAE